MTELHAETAHPDMLVGASAGAGPNDILVSPQGMTH